MKTNDPYHIDLIRIVMYHWRTLFFPSLAVAIVVGLVMLFRPNYYASTAVFYPVNGAIAQGLTPDNDKGIDFYGDANDIDRILSIGQSQSFIYEFATIYKLDEEYGYDLTTPKGQERLLKKCTRLYQIEKTDRDGMRMSVEDRSPERAQQLALGAYELLESSIKQLNIRSLETIYESAENQRKSLEKSLNVLSDSIRIARIRYGIYDSESQGEVLAKLEMDASKKSAERILRYSQGIGLVNQWEASQEEFARQLTYASVTSERIRQALQADYPVFYSIQSPAIPFIKSRPARSLFVIAAGLTTAFFMLCYLLVRIQFLNSRQAV